MDIFEDTRLRSRIQSIILDEIVVDAPGYYQVRVPDRLVEEIAVLLRPHVKKGARYG